ncbi:MAG: alanine--tRNA ligase [Wenzhouxiangellaceae bacterium]
MRSIAEIRQGFLDYFTAKGHQVVPSSPLVPANDATLLFTNAGMVQFKDVFLGAEKRAYKRAVSSQRCVRAGGKHNDLDQVGYTARHHTFFEMLGNFSFGDYFKREAVEYAWEFLTQVLQLPAERLLVTVYETDDEAYALWTEHIGVPAERVLRIGDKPGAGAYQSDNFWAMGDTGPCGPCSEIFYDHGPEIAGGPPGSADEDGDRYIEIWNLVFMQYDRAADGTMTPLPKPCVDTGMGLERLAAVLQGVHSNYEVDLFQALIAAAAGITGVKDLQTPSLRVIADHIRSCAFLITDGVLPSNDGRGYVLRRIIRRAVRHGYKLGVRDAFFWRMTAPLVEQMGQAYPELAAAQNKIETLLKAEEERFMETLGQGMELLDSVIAGLDGQQIPGDTVFKLYDTYGFPPDLTADIARERGLTVDQAGFEQAMAGQRERARAASRFEQTDNIPSSVVQNLEPTKFTGYDELRSQAVVLVLIANGEAVEELAPGDSGIVILDRTPFYAESGGQVGDQGALKSEESRFVVSDTVKIAGQYHGHKGQATDGPLRLGDIVEARVDEPRRADIVRHHSATHLLHAALRKVLGDHVEQKGSLVAPDRLRFDFSHFQPLSHDELRQIERLVNDEIRANQEAEVRYSSYDQAVEAGAMALFGEKYGDTVRVLRFGDFSVELCGGTHVSRVGDIGAFKIIGESGIAAGVRRIEAVAGPHAEAWTAAAEETLQRLGGLLKTSPYKLEEKLTQLLAKVRGQDKEIERLQSERAKSAVDSLSSQVFEVENVKVLSTRLDGVDAAGLREAVDRFKQSLGSAVVVLATVDEGKVRLAVGVSKALTGTLHAGQLAGFVAEQVGGKGGGRPDMAQAGGNDPSQLSAALASVGDWVAGRVG